MNWLVRPGIPVLVVLVRGRLHQGFQFCIVEDGDWLVRLIVLTFELVKVPPKLVSQSTAIIVESQILGVDA